uniref:hypothetical protein n=1 Tax=Clostridioides sp. ES-S-0173-01 TaxID=2770786 RepID=UPI001E292250|nr:hypothetical protein [Clostridioides sp. ES-S-0173-01]UDN49515.1 hypothetical protein JJJ25_19570 [Clostridioides sp. ES-S-0173-01]
MKTPSRFRYRLEKGIITEEILGMVIFSLNKKAKVYKEKEAEQRMFIDGDYLLEEKYRCQKEEYYSKKKYLLSLINPTCIHKENIPTSFTVSLDDHDFDKNYCEFIEDVTYFDKDIKDYREKYKVHVKYNINNYYLFYRLDRFCFHEYIAKNEFSDGYVYDVNEDNLINKYKLDIQTVDKIFSPVVDKEELLSDKFCDKVIYMLENKLANIILEDITNDK